MIYELAEETRYRLDQRGEWSALSGDRREGFFRLFNKNGGETLYVKPVGQVENRMAWYVEYDGEVPRYFKDVLKTVGAS